MQLKIPFETDPIIAAMEFEGHPKMMPWQISNVAGISKWCSSASRVNNKATVLHFISSTLVYDMSLLSRRYLRINRLTTCKRGDVLVLSFAISFVEVDVLTLLFIVSLCVCVCVLAVIVFWFLFGFFSMYLYLYMIIMRIQND